MPPESADKDRVTAALADTRAALLAYLTRFIVRPDVAEELVQGTAVRALEHLDAAPLDTRGLRRWIFRIATNLALDERKRHGRWRESLMGDIKDYAERTQSRDLARPPAGSPELRSIGREHLAFCLACTLGRLPPGEAAALLLREVCGFSRDEAAEILEVDSVSVKNQLQRARKATRAAYQDTCALVTKQGACYQCAELDGAYGSGEKRDPLDGAPDRLAARLQVVRGQSLGAWTRHLGVLLASLESE